MIIDAPPPPAPRRHAFATHPRGPARPAGGLVTRGAPPLALPAAYFAAALAYWVAGAAGLVWVAPEIARGEFSPPRVVVVAHLFTLGWITTTMMGALYQFLPVALLTPIRSERVAHGTLALYAPGLALFAAGLLAGSHRAVMAGGVIFGTALLLFAGNLAATLRRAPERNVTWWALVGATVSLVSTVALGLSLAGNLRWGHLGADRVLAIGVHLHVAVAGWVMLVIAGVAHRLLPMFLLSHGATERFGKLSVGLLAAGVSLLLVSHHGLTPALIGVIAVLLAGGVGSFLVQAALFFRHRRKPALDPGLRLAGVGIALLVLALALAPLFLAKGVAAPRLATGYVVALLSGLSLFVAGHYYKIVPFLLWFHRCGPLVGKQPLPRVADLYAPAPANAAGALLAAGALGLVAVTLAGVEMAARPVAALFAAGALLLAAQMVALSRWRP